MTAPTWISGAHSTATMTAGGWFSFTVPTGVAGVAAGLNTADTTTDPSEIQHGLVFSSGQFYVAELGVRRTSDATYSDGEVFHVLRSGEKVYYCRGTASSVAPGVVLPGTLIYASTAPSAGTVILDASILGIGDRIDGLTFMEEPVGGVAVLAMKPMLVQVSDTYTSSAVVAFKPLELGATTDRGEVQASFLCFDLLASDQDYGQVLVGFQPLEASGLAGEPVTDIVDVAFSPFSLYAEAGEQTQSAIDVNLPPLVAIAVDADYAQAVVAMRPLATYAQADLTDTGNYFRIYLPALSPNAIANNSARSAAIEDRANAFDTVLGEVVAVLNDKATASDQAIPTIARTRAIEDVAYGSDTVLSATRIPVVEDGFLASDELATGVAVLVSDALSAFDELIAAVATVLLVEDALKASDFADSSVLVLVEDGMLASDNALAEESVALTDVALASDELIAGTLELALLDDAAITSDSFEISVQSAATLIDTLLASDELIVRTPGLTAWVLNTESGGVCWYDNWSFTCMAAASGKVFAVGPDGLMVLGGATDDGAAINSEVQYGFTDFGGYDRSGSPAGNPYKKRVAQYWFDYYSEGSIEISVETYGENFSGYTYTMPSRPAMSPRNGRIEPGRGLVARYWRLAVRNSAGADFSINSIAADTLQSARKL